MGLYFLFRFLHASSKNKIHFTGSPPLLGDTTVWEKVSLSSIKLFDASYRVLITHTGHNITTTFTVNGETTSGHRVRWFLQLSAVVVDTISYP